MTSNPPSDWLPNDVHELERQRSELESALAEQQSVTEALRQKIESLVAEVLPLRHPVAMTLLSRAQQV